MEGLPHCPECGYEGDHYNPEVNAYYCPIDQRGEWDQAGADPDARPPGMAPYADDDDFGPG
jgi:hypothetical protein